MYTVRGKVKGKSDGRVSVIGGADGPTSIFIAGRDKVSFAEKMKRHRYQKKRAKMENMLQADFHTIEETIEYMIEKYHAEEMLKEDFLYTERYICLKEALILKYKPELLGEWSDIQPPTDYGETSLKEFFCELDKRKEKVSEIPDHCMPLDFHIYTIDISKIGQIQFEVEKNRGILSGGYSGEKKGIKKLSEIAKDIYLYYGFSEEDKKNRTERFQSVVTILTS